MEEEIFNQKQMRDAIENELRTLVYNLIPAEYQGMLPMLTYHMGWEGEGAGPDAQGKRIRPILVLLCAAAAGGEWQKALPAAAAVELIHNFSLIHDDIQDQSAKRRGRDTVWIKWGVAQAINAGDLMFTMAFSALDKLRGVLPDGLILEAFAVLHRTCVQLTGGQHLDITYENLRNLTVDDYWPMIQGKTASLIACCCELGAISAEATTAQRQDFHEFGKRIGLAFQVQDDYLGIWGNAEKTGKSTVSDLLSGKKTLPVIYALNQEKKFAERWLRGPLDPTEVNQVVRLLELEGAKDFTVQNSDQLTREALAALERASGSRVGKQALIQMAQMLISRDN